MEELAAKHCWLRGPTAESQFTDCKLLIVAVLPKSGKIALSMMDGRIHMDQFQPLLEVVTTGCESVYHVLRDAVVKRTEALALNSTVGAG